MLKEPGHPYAVTAQIHRSTIYKLQTFKCNLENGATGKKALLMRKKKSERIF